MAFTPFSGSATSSVDNLGLSGMSREVVLLVNSLANVVAHMMPGVLLSAPANKTGTTAATAWRTEAFTFMFRGKATSAAAQEKALTGTTHDVAASKEAWFYLTLQTNGTSFTVTKAADQTIGTKVLPTLVDNEVHVGTLKITTGVTGFVAATDDLVADGAKIATINFYDPPHIYQIGSAGAGVVLTA
jgi:hypothetical protein